MKFILPLLVIISCTFVSFSQKKCSSNKHIVNEIPLTKCEIKEWKGEASNSKTKKIVSLNLSSRRHRTVRKDIVKETPRKEVSYLTNIQNSVNLKRENDIIDALVSESIKEEIIMTKEIFPNVILFNMVEEIPLFPECNGLLDDKKQEKCFNNQMSKHFIDNFYPENISEEKISGKAFLQFIIEKDGSISNIFVKGSKNGQLLVKEIKRVISKLPKFIPGKHKGQTIKVKYSLPLNFTEL